MKTYFYILILVFFVSCSTTRVTDSWLNDNYKNYQPKKVLIIGLTDNLNGRTLFEDQLRAEFNKRGIEAVQSYNVFRPTFTNIKQNEADIEKEIARFSNDGFDTVLISAVKGLDDKVSYSGDDIRRRTYWRRFGRYYFLSQDIYFEEGYYTKYRIYHLEATMYNLKENNEKSLVWVASIDLVDPKQVNSTVKDYVGAILKSLEKKQIIEANQ